MAPRQITATIALTLASLALGGTSEFEISIDNDCWDGLGSPFNDVRMVNVATGLGLASGTRVDIIGVGWNVTIDTFDSGSWLSEASVLFEDPDEFPIDFEAFSISPGAGVNDFGRQTFNSGGIIMLQSSGLDNLILDNGVLRLEFFETFDDFAAEVDAEMTGTITVLTTADLGPCSPADVTEPFGTLDLADITAFITAFVNQDPIADIAPPVGTFDLVDIVTFVTMFSAGCE